MTEFSLPTWPQNLEVQHQREKLINFSNNFGKAKLTMLKMNPQPTLAQPQPPNAKYPNTPEDAEKPPTLMP